MSCDVVALLQRVGTMGWDEWFYKMRENNSIVEAE